MATRGAAGRVLISRQEIVLLAATGILVAFHYLTRTDVVGISAPGRAWAPLTGRPLDPDAHFLLAGLVLGVVPSVLAVVLCRIAPRNLGLGLGCWREGLLWLAVGLPLAVLAGKVGSASADIRAVYPLDTSLTPVPEQFILHAFRQFLYFGAWEVLFRGVLLFSLRPQFGSSGAVVIQTVLSVIAHFGRPLDETLAALPAGLVFGCVTLRVRSVWYLAVVHWVVGVSLDWFVLTS